MTVLDTTIPPLALKMLNKYGKQITITTNTLGAYDVSTGAPATSVAVSQTVAASIEEYADNLRFLGDKAMPNSSIVEGDKKASIAAQGLTFVPNVGDTATIGADGFSIIGVGTMWSGELAAMYVLHVRKV